MDLELRELLIILIVAAACCAFVYFERGRDAGVLTAALYLLGGFAVLGAIAVVAT